MIKSSEILVQSKWPNKDFCHHQDTYFCFSITSIYKYNYRKLKKNNNNNLLLQSLQGVFQRKPYTELKFFIKTMNFSNTPRSPPCSHGNYVTFQEQ